jgi:hypothetical protein
MTVERSVITQGAFASMRKLGERLREAGFDAEVVCPPGSSPRG